MFKFPFQKLNLTDVIFFQNEEFSFQILLIIDKQLQFVAQICNQIEGLFFFDLEIQQFVFLIQNPVSFFVFLFLESVE